MENIDAPKLSKALLQKYTEQIKPPIMSGGGIFYGLACENNYYFFFLCTNYFVNYQSKLMEYTDTQY